MQRAFTLIELIAVISVMTILGMVSITGVSKTLRQLGTDRAGETVVTAALQARDLARHPYRLNQREDSKRYGVVLIDADATHKARVAITYGDQVSPATILITASGDPFFSRELPAAAVFHVRSGPNWVRLRDSGTYTGWMFRYETGQTALQISHDLKPNFVGVEQAVARDSGLDPATCEFRHDGLGLGLDDRPRLFISCLATGQALTEPGL